MERDSVKNNNSSNQPGEGVCGVNPETTTEFVLQWGNRKRLRCMKIQVKDNSTDKTRVRVDRRIVRTEREPSNRTTATTNHHNLRRLPPSSPQTHRILRNSEASCTMKGQSNGVRTPFSSPDRVGEEERSQDKKESRNNHKNNHNRKNGNDNHHNNTSETAQDSKKGNSSSGSEAIPVWPPKFVIALTNKEKEEDFMAIKGSKLPQRPKKRAKFIQRTLNLVCPGSWLCDLTLERYEVREKKISKKVSLC
uniref:Uncharacterized protein n=1 Tax=Nelumbo nucifera TaxID=4432 RepID=A0A823A0S9_NELNU|nr:TPA_asm: hypothetical protein HUJ06_018856 [Nelumbo nucifera]